MNRRLMLERSADRVAAWNRHDADGIVAYAVDDLILRDVALRMPLHGREAVRAAAADYLRVFPYDDDALLIEAAMYWNPLALLHQLGVAVMSEQPSAA